MRVWRRRDFSLIFWGQTCTCCHLDSFVFFVVHFYYLLFDDSLINFLIGMQFLHVTTCFNRALISLFKKAGEFLAP